MWSAFKVASVTSTKSLFYIYKWSQVLPPHTQPLLFGQIHGWPKPYIQMNLWLLYSYYAMLNSFEFLDFPISRPFLVSLCEILSFWQLVTFYNFLQLAANPQRVRADLHKLPLRPVFKHEAAQLKVTPSKSDLNRFQEKNKKGMSFFEICLTLNCFRGTGFAGKKFYLRAALYCILLRGVADRESILWLLHCLAFGWIACRGCLALCNTSHCK